MYDLAASLSLSNSLGFDALEQQKKETTAINNKKKTQYSCKTTPLYILLKAQLHI